jgi:uncharacterized protein YukE
VAGVAAVVRRISDDFGGEQGANGRQPARAQRVASLLGELEQEVAGVVMTFQGGLDSPNSPLNDPQALQAAAGRLDSATRKAEQVLREIESLRGDNRSGTR